jgi:hypothetical protein
MFRYIIYTRQFKHNPSGAIYDHVFEPLFLTYEHDKLFADINNGSIFLRDGLDEWTKQKSRESSINIIFSGRYDSIIRKSDTIFELLEGIMSRCTRFKNPSCLRNLLFKILTGAIDTAKPKLKYCDLNVSSIPYEVLIVENDLDNHTFNLISIMFSKDDTIFKFFSGAIKIKITQQSGIYF